MPTSIRTTDLLLDTHALLWWVVDDRRLSETARSSISQATRVVASHASLWEIAIKSALGRLTLDRPAGDWFSHFVDSYRFSEMAIDRAHIAAVEQLPMHHGDPFDRLLICQAQSESLPLVTKDHAFGSYDVKTIW